ncbi:MAG: hypothetical protein AAFZ15_25270 [Bacteroidota bacterium]
MKDTQLYFIFRRLNKSACNAIAELALCPVFNKKQEVGRLCAYFARHLSSTDRLLFAKKNVFHYVFPGEPYNDARLRQATFATLKLIERYLAIQEMEGNGTERELYLLRALRNHGMDKRLDKKMKLLQSQLQNSTRRDAKWNRQNHDLASEALQRISSRRRSSKLVMHPLHDHLTSYYLSEMLRHACSALTHQSISAQVYDLNLLEQVLQLAESFGFAQRPSIAIYYHACKSLQSPENQIHFDYWKKYLKRSAGEFSDAELRGIYLLGINFCIRQMNRGNQQFIREAFDLYHAALERDLLTEGGYITAFTFKNIIRIGTALQEEEWTAAFFAKYQHLLHPTERTNITRYNKAFLFFSKGAYDQAMPLLQQVEFADTLNNLDARRMLLRSYFELGEMQALDSLLHSFSTFLHRQRDLGYHRDMYLNLTRLLRQFIEMPPDDITALDKLLVKVEATSPVAEKDWLLEKINGQLNG